MCIACMNAITISMSAINIALASFIYTCLFIHGLRLRKPRERVKSDQQYLSEKVTCSFKVFAGYTCKLLYMFTDFQVSERLHRGPEFSHNHLIDYLINYTIITS